jgi:hypothetical protein
VSLTAIIELLGEKCWKRRELADELLIFAKRWKFSGSELVIEEKQGIIGICDLEIEILCGRSGSDRGRISIHKIMHGCIRVFTDNGRRDL